MAFHSQKHPSVIFGIIWTALFVMSPHATDPRVVPALLTLAIVMPPILLLRSERENLLYNWAWTTLGILYLGWMLSHYIALRDIPQGRELVLLVVLSTFACDTSAFFTGRTWGKHHLAPKVSPEKTWEGSAGGFLGAIAASLILALIFDELNIGLTISCWQIVLLGSLVGIFSQMGDLVESKLKRATGKKDSGKCLPGHGGILDRIDSIIFTGIVVYYCVTWFMM
jgi:phosphatidate cytidylyltransferase